MGPLEHLPDILKAHEEKVTGLQAELDAKNEALADSEARVLHMRSQFGFALGQQEHAIANLRETLQLPASDVENEKLQNLRLELRSLTDAISEASYDDPVATRVRVALQTALATDRVSAERHAVYLLSQPPEQLANTFNPYILAMLIDPRLRRALLEAMLAYALAQG